MDDRRFDAIARRLGEVRSRRGLLRVASALALAGAAGSRWRPVQAHDCPSGTAHCGGNPTAACCPLGEKCCVSTGVCCGPNAACFRLPDGDICRPECQPNAFRCAGGAGDCCPAGQDCCGEGFRICCGPNDTCFRPGGGGTPYCLRKCDLGFSRCSQSGDCCPILVGVCCGEGNRTCCGQGEFCDERSGAVSACAGLCPDPFQRRCGGAGDGDCCPQQQRCCGTTCCPSGSICTNSTRCVRLRKRKRRRRRRR
mgnify:CR=1 FL=1